MIVNDLLQSLGRSNMLLFGFYDRQWSLTKTRSPKYVFYLLSMIVNDLLKSLSCLNMSYLDSMIVNDLFHNLGRRKKCIIWPYMIVNDLLKNLGRPNMFFIWSLWSSMISCKASVAQIRFLFNLYHRQWSLAKPRSSKYVFYLISMIVNDLLQSLGRPKMCII